MNPFLLRGYKGEEYFCDREKETLQIVDSIRNGQDVTLFGLRRLGKSALIHHVFNHLKDEFHCVYVDIWGSTSIEEFTKELVNGFLNSNIQKNRRFSSKILEFLRSLGASFSINSDGIPNVDIIYKDRNMEFGSLSELFVFINSLDISVVLAIDEFQEIRKYENSSPFEAKLRSLTQLSENVQFIFSGSEKHLLSDIFTSYQMPFYQSTRMVSIDSIKKERYMEFALKHFENASKAVRSEVIEYIMDSSYTHTYYTQALLNLLYSQRKKNVTLEEYQEILSQYILEKAVFYSELPERLTRQQFSVLKAIGKSGKIASPTSAEFMQFAGVSSPSSMYRNIQSLLDKQHILKDGDGYRLYDVFLEFFMKMHM